MCTCAGSSVLALQENAVLRVFLFCSARKHPELMILIASTRELAMREARMVERRAHLAAVHGHDTQPTPVSPSNERVEGLAGAMDQLYVDASYMSSTNSSLNHGLPSPPPLRSSSSQSNFPSFAEGDNRLFGDQGGDRDCVVCLAAERTVGTGRSEVFVHVTFFRSFSSRVRALLFVLVSRLFLDTD